MSGYVVDTVQLLKWNECHTLSGTCHADILSRPRSHPSFPPQQFTVSAGQLCRSLWHWSSEETPCWIPVIRPLLRFIGGRLPFEGSWAVLCCAAWPTETVPVGLSKYHMLSLLLFFSISITTYKYPLLWIEIICLILAAYRFMYLFIRYWVCWSQECYWLTWWILTSP